MRRSHPILLGVVLLVLLGIAACAAVATHPKIDEVPTPVSGGFDQALVLKGAMLAAAGDCASCHTTAGGRAFAGGVPLQTPFGVIHGTNITPDRETGIGAWSEDAFKRALREGIARDGSQLYPAFPYNHFTRLADGDISALYAFLMTRDPVRQATPENKLVFPLGFRPLVAGWNLLYLDKGPVPPVANQSAEWNRGAYLVDALGHCAACHTPRDRLGGERKDAFLAGGEAEGWHAPALNAQSPSPVPWTAQTLAIYLRTGIAADHAMSAGPMRPVVENLARIPESDVHAMATYIAAQMGSGTPERQAREADARRRAQSPSLQSQPVAQGGNDAQMALGASVYAGSCAACHDLGRGASSSEALRLPLAVALHLPDARNLIHIIREGIAPAPGEPGRWMPGFGASLTDEQLEALLAWLRSTGTSAPPWPDLARTVKQTGDAP